MLNLHDALTYIVQVTNFHVNSTVFFVPSLCLCLQRGRQPLELHQANVFAVVLYIPIVMTQHYYPLDT